MRIRDPVHGDILLPGFARDLLDTAAMQRLRGIRQLGFAHLVYPGCVHTRFDHSLGTAHTAQKLWQALSTGDDETELAVLTAAALLHDIAHVPFGHTLEDEFGVFARHDVAARMGEALMDSELRAVLRREGIEQMVSDILLGSLPGERQYLRDIISSTVDADVLDYLRRDAYFAGLVQDYDDRVIANFTLYDDRMVYRLFHKGLLRQDARSELLHLLRLRYYLTERVCFHHTKIAAGAMLVKLIELLGVTLAEMQNHGDDVLLFLLRERAARSGLPAAEELAERLLRRQLFKRCFVVSAAVDLASVWARRKETEAMIAEAADVPDSSVCVYLGPLSSFKEMAVPVLLDRHVIPLYQLQESEARFLQDEYERLCRFYVFAPQEQREKVQKAAEEVLGRRSEFRILRG